MVVVVEQRLDSGSVFVDVCPEAGESDSERSVLHEISWFESWVRSVNLLQVVCQ
jgi:hypothetical protein